MKEEDRIYWQKMSYVALSNESEDSFVVSAPPAYGGMAIFSIRRFVIEELDRRFRVVAKPVQEFGIDRGKPEVRLTEDTREKAKDLAHCLAEEFALGVAQAYGIRYTKMLR